MKFTNFWLNNEITVQRSFASDIDNSVHSNIILHSLSFTRWNFSLLSTISLNLFFCTRYGHFTFKNPFPQHTHILQMSQEMLQNMIFNISVQTSRSELAIFKLLCYISAASVKHSWWCCHLFAMQVMIEFNTREKLVIIDIHW